LGGSWFLPSFFLSLGIIKNKKVMDVRDVIAQNEFGMDYDQLGPGEKEWVNDEIDNLPS
jgi:hypothetical protein